MVETFSGRFYRKESKEIGSQEYKKMVAQSFHTSRDKRSQTPNGSDPTSTKTGETGFECVAERARIRLFRRDNKGLVTAPQEETIFQHHHDDPLPMEW